MTTTTNTEPHDSVFSAPCGSYYDSAADGLASNFGAFDMTPTASPEGTALLTKAPRETDREPSDFFFELLMSRWTRAALAAMAIGVGLLITGCGGTDHPTATTTDLCSAIAYAADCMPTTTTRG